MLEFENLGLVEMTQLEMQETDGGIFWFGLIAVIICLAVAISQL